jgi:site-specific DNA-methyltransferase (adenine-specific)
LLEEEDGIVIDPFCGTGTTLVAAKLLGKKYIGIDISEEYVEYAKRRLEKEKRKR